MVRLALVQAETGASLHVGVERPLDHEQRPYDPSDFAKRDGQVMLARTGRGLRRSSLGRIAPDAIVATLRTT